MDNASKSWQSFIGMFGSLNQLTIVNGTFNQVGIENFFDDVLLNRPLKSFALKKCKITDECLKCVCEAIQLSTCQIERLCFDLCNIKDAHTVSYL